MHAIARRALPILALVQPLAGALNPLTGLGVSLGERASRNGIPPELPPGAFFSIWSVIFLAYGVFAVYAALRDEPLSRTLSPPLALAGAANIVWMLEAQLITWMPLDYALLFAVAVPAWTAATRLDRMRGLGGSAMKFTADMATGLLAGWITVAIAISGPMLIRDLTGLGVTDRIWLMLWITLATAGAGAWLAATRVTRSPFFFVALAWGLAGVAMNNFTRTDMGFLGWATVFTGGLIILLRAVRGAKGAVSPLPRPSFASG